MKFVTLLTLIFSLAFQAPAAHALPLMPKEYDSLKFDDVLVYERTPKGLKFSRCPVNRQDCQALGAVSLQALKELRDNLADMSEADYVVLQRNLEAAPSPDSGWKTVGTILFTYVSLAMAWASFSPKVGDTMAMFMRQAIWGVSRQHVKLSRLRVLNQVLLATPLLISIVYGSYSGIAAWLASTRKQREISKELVVSTMDQLMASLTHTMNTTKVGQTGSIALPLWLWEQVEEWEGAEQQGTEARGVTLR